MKGVFIQQMFTSYTFSGRLIIMVYTTLIQLHPGQAAGHC